MVFLAPLEKEITEDIQFHTGRDSLDYKRKGFRHARNAGSHHVFLPFFLAPPPLSPPASFAAAFLILSRPAPSPPAARPANVLPRSAFADFLPTGRAPVPPRPRGAGAPPPGRRRRGRPPGPRRSS